ncbi:hypothetical protein D3C83_46030 [compost metagenome]
MHDLDRRARLACARVLVDREDARQAGEAVPAHRRVHEVRGDDPRLLRVEADRPQGGFAQLGRLGDAQDDFVTHRALLPL